MLNMGFLCGLVTGVMVGIWDSCVGYCSQVADLCDSNVGALL